jgi:hypothetical protein
VWKLVSDPYSLPRWWPRVARVEGVDQFGWTTVLTSPQGRQVRADWQLDTSERGVRRQWSQDLEGTPFERIFDSHVVAVSLSDTEVTIEVEQKLHGWARFAPFLVKRAARRQLREALDGLAEALS